MKIKFKMIQIVDEFEFELFLPLAYFLFTSASGMCCSLSGIWREPRDEEEVWMSFFWITAELIPTGVFWSSLACGSSLATKLLILIWNNKVKMIIFLSVRAFFKEITIISCILSILKDFSRENCFKWLNTMRQTQPHGSFLSNICTVQIDNLVGHYLWFH